MFLQELSMSLVASLVCIGAMLLFLGIEASTSALVSIWFVGGALAAAIVSIFTSNIIVLSLVFIIVSVLLLLLFRKKILERKTEVITTNAESLVGKTAKVVSADKDEIRVFVSSGDTTWHAECLTNETFAVDETVRITSINGNKLMIEKITSDSKGE